MFSWIKRLFKRKVKGYKATNMDMTCRDYQFGIGKFHHEGDVIPCRQGFHFCETLEDVFTYYGYRKCRIFEVQGSGKIMYQDDKVVCSDIEFLKEIDYEQYLDSKNIFMLTAIANNGIGLDKLITNHHWLVRRAVARQGFGLHILVNDRDHEVRKAVADQGYGLDKLVNDWNFDVRLSVAKQGHALDILKNDEHFMVSGEAKRQLYPPKKPQFMVTI